MNAAAPVDAVDAPGPSWREHALAQALCLALLIWIFRLGSANLRIPFAYSGDALFTLMLAKGGLDTGWYLTNPLLGAPYQLEMYDHPVGGNVHFAFIKLLSWLCRDAPLSINLYFLLGFSLTTFSALSVLRRLALGARPALLAALLFAFLPYHLMRGQVHLFLASYYAIPPAILLSYWLTTGRLRLTWPLDRRAGAAFAILALVASSNVYYAWFTGVLLLVHGVLSAWRFASADAERWFGFDRRLLLTTAVLAGALALAFAVNIAPNLAHIASHGRNQAVAHRDPQESELYGLRLGSLLLPMPDHRVPALREVRARYDQKSATGETTSSALGVVGSLGFLLSIAELLRRKRHELGRFLSESTLLLVLLGTTGGLGSLIALFVTPLVRAYGRVSVFLGFLALACVAHALERSTPWLRARWRWPHVSDALCAGVLLLGLLDQTSPRLSPDHAALRTAFEGDRAFVQKIEAQLPAASRVFVLPYLAFPEAVDRIAVNDLFRGYMHSTHLRFSAGAMNGTYAARWQAQIAGLPPQKLIESLTLAGFHGLYLDRRGIVAPTTLEAALSARLGPPLVNGGGELSFFNLLRAGRPTTPDPSVREHVIEPVLAAWSGFFPEERDGTRVWRWSSGRGALELLNPSAKPRQVQLSFLCYAASPAGVHLHLSGAFQHDLAIANQRQPLERTLTLPPGATTLRFAADGQAVVPPRDNRPLSFAVEDFQLTELD